MKLFAAATCSVFGHFAAANNGILPSCSVTCSKNEGIIQSLTECSDCVPIVLSSYRRHETNNSSTKKLCVKRTSFNSVGGRFHAQDTAKVRRHLRFDNLGSDF